MSPHSPDPFHAFKTYRDAFLAAVDGGQDGDGEQESAQSYGLISPYVSLRYFNNETTVLLSGRDHMRKQIVKRLSETQIVFVIGGSGCGKSSVVRGAVLNHLRSAAVPVAGRQGSWVAVDFRPGTDPVEQFVAAFDRQFFGMLLKSAAYKDKILEYFFKRSGDASAQDGLVSMLRKQMRDDLTVDVGLPRGEEPKPEAPPLHSGMTSAFRWVRNLTRAVQSKERDDSASGPDAEPNLALLIDQFEEIFRSNVNKQEAEDLFSMIRCVHQQKPPGVFLLITMRAEDLHRCSQVPGIADIVNESVFLLDMMGRRELRQAIYEPARKVLDQWDVRYDRTTETAPYDPEVVERILDDVEALRDRLEHPLDHLPLFEHALTDLWYRKIRDLDDNKDQRPFQVRMEDLETAWPNMHKVQGKWLQNALRDDVKEALVEAEQKFVEVWSAAQPEAPEKPGKVADAALRAALCAITSKDENERFYREFINPTELVEQRMASTESFGPDQDATTRALSAALDVLVQHGFLVRSEVNERHQYDVTHEALIRNSAIRDWVDREAEVFSALNRTLDADAVIETDYPKLAVLFEDKKSDFIRNVHYRRTFSLNWIVRALRRRKEQAREHQEDAAGTFGKRDIARARDLFLEKKQSKLDDLDREKSEATRAIRERLKEQRRTLKEQKKRARLAIVATAAVVTIGWLGIAALKGNTADREKEILRSENEGLKAGYALMRDALDHLDRAYGLYNQHAIGRSNRVAMKREGWANETLLGLVPWMEKDFSQHATLSARAEIDGRMRQLFGTGYQVLSWNRFEELVSDPVEHKLDCIKIGNGKDQTIRLGNTGAVLHYTKSAGIRFARNDGSGNAGETLNTRDLPPNLGFEQGQKGQVCTNPELEELDTGQFLVISKNRLPSKGIASSTIPEVIMVHGLIRDNEEQEQDRLKLRRLGSPHSIDTSFLDPESFNAGNPFGPDIGSRAEGTIKVGTHGLIGVKMQNSHLKGSDKGVKEFAVIFHPELAQPVREKNKKVPQGDAANLHSFSNLTLNDQSAVYLSLDDLEVHKIGHKMMLHVLTSRCEGRPPLVTITLVVPNENQQKSPGNFDEIKARCEEDRLKPSDSYEASGPVQFEISAKHLALEETEGHEILLIQDEGGDVWRYPVAYDVDAVLEFLRTFRDLAEKEHMGQSGEN
ncbi:nSTAND1 domain-containing NTPase [Ruegeria arenilitoris]|uniref:nSTAND1 domain-containing NTPase n=1 Tax=Ruegeria arenilitoris TaxID=1173585 RepID=UPI00147FF486|nr:hypothetical protein [Ruegeria arenilitoris]